MKGLGQGRQKRRLN